MDIQNAIPRPPVAKTGLVRSSLRVALGLCLGLFLSTQAFAQYGGGSGGTGMPGTPGYIPPKGGYGSGAAIGAGVGAAAGLGILYLALHHRGAVTGCVRHTDDGFSLVDEKNNKTYSLVSGSIDLKPGEQVQVKGKKSNGENGAASFQAKKVVKDLGACSVESAASPAHP
jgi:hypothetical protein